MSTACFAHESSAATASKSRSKSTPLRINTPGDAYEREADRVAERVGRGERVSGWSLSSAGLGRIQRDSTTHPDGQTGPPPKPLSTDDMIKKVGEALLATKEGKAAVNAIKKDPVVKSTTDFLSTPAGIIIGGAAATGVVAGLAAAKKPLPFQIPQIPLDFIHPGLGVKLNYEGPVNHPSAASITLSFTPPGSKKKVEKPNYAAEAAQIRAELDMFRPKNQDTAGLGPVAFSQKPAPAAQQQPAPAAQQAPDVITGADPAASHVDKTPAPVANGDSSATPEHKKREDDVIQRKALATVEPAHLHAGGVEGALRGHGRPLDSDTRRFMESRIGADFQKVRVFTDSRAADSARSLNARAYTTGSNIVFDAGKYQPHSAAGKKLLAHELAHVVQQDGNLSARNAASQRTPEGSGKSAAAATPLRIGPVHDRFEQEADRAAEKVTSGDRRRGAWSLSRVGLGAIQRQCSCGGSCDDCNKKKQMLQRRATSLSAPASDHAPASVAATLSRPGSSLDAGTRSFMESRFGHDFSGVRIHTDGQAADSARDVNAAAYTVGNQIVFGSGHFAPSSARGRTLLAHELAHVVQQAGQSTNASVSSSGVVQRYEAGEHAQFGEAGDELKRITPTKALDYKVKAGETPEVIAKKFQVTVEDLLAANPDKVHHWRLKNPDRIRDGFYAEDTIAIPATNNPALKEAIKTKEISLSVNGVILEYGEVIAMGDFYATAADMLAASDTELKELSRLIKLEKEGKGVPIDKRDEQWGQVTGGRYAKLAVDNEKHFSPSNAAIAPVSGKSTGDNKSEWETNHKTAVQTSQSGDKDKALATNGFADHFLTDAFSAGHLINKRDVMEEFKGKLPKTSAGEFTTASKAFFDDLATKAFTGDVQTAFSALKTVDCFNTDKKVVPCSNWISAHAEINSAERFSTLLQGIQKERPDLMSSAVAKNVHDTLNTLPGGLPVENNMGDKWQLSGDKTLNADTIKIGKKAVAQSQMNVLTNFKVAGALDFPALFKRVWDFVPRPQAGAAQKTVTDTATTGTDPTKPGIADSIVKLIRNNLTEIVKALTTAPINKLMPK